MEMSILRQLYESSNSSQRIPQPIRGRFRGQSDHVVLDLSWISAPRKMKVTPTRMEYRVAKGSRNSRAAEGDRQAHGPATARIGSNHLHAGEIQHWFIPMNILDASEQGVRRTVQVQLKLQRRLQLLGD